MDAEFWFYEGPERTRGEFWRLSHTEGCRVLPGTWRIGTRYVNFSICRHLSAFDPDILMLGGFSIPANYFAYLWARRHRRKVVVFTERSRDRRGRLRGLGLAWRALRRMYKDVDLIIVSAADAVTQFRDVLGFGGKVVEGRYAADIDGYLEHPARVERPSYTLLFPNRLTAIYDPLLAVDIFAEFLRRHPGSILMMNARGELAARTRRRVAELMLVNNVQFLDAIQGWDDLPRIYARADIMILPARFSNGNFTILESMASGLGIVVSDRVLGVGGLIEDGVNGFRCEPTLSAFVERLERYVATPSLFAQHSRRNRELVAPLGVKTTAAFVAELLATHLGRS